MPPKHNSPINDGRLRVQLASVGNPDHGQNPEAPMYGADLDAWRVVGSIEEASDVCCNFIDENDLGGGNWSGGNVFRDGEMVARISYNGRIWNPDGSAYEAGQSQELVNDTNERDAVNDAAREVAGKTPKRRSSSPGLGM